MLDQDFESLTVSSFVLATFKHGTILEISFLITINSVSRMQQSLRHIYFDALYKAHMALFLRWILVDLETMLKIRV